MVRTLVFACALLAACKERQQPPLTIFNAAALGPPFRALGDGLVNRGLLTRVDLESSPSLEAVRKVTALDKRPDLLAVADLSLLDSIVLPNYSTWYLVFGSNALVLAYGPHSAHHEGLSDSNWVEVLLTPEVRIGRSDPRVDPSGYRTLLAVQLVERFYHRPGLAAALLQAMPERYVRHAEADLSALIQAGELDYVWTYRNLALAHQLQWIELPPEINLESPDLASWYAQAEVDIPAPGNGSPLHVRGAPILFGLTIPSGAPSPSQAEVFISHILGTEGRKAIAATGFSMLSQPYLVGTGAPASVTDAVTKH